jgi:hypothetical protein
MALQTGYFDDSGSDTGSRYYVLAGFIAPNDQWTDVANKWRAALDRENIPFFKMAHAMALDGIFRRGWTAPLRDKLILELAEIVAEIDPWRVECFVNRELFNTFVKGILQTDTFNDPYFMLFYQIVLATAANADRIGWTPKCEFIFDEQGKLGTNANSKWKWVKTNIDGVGQADLSRHLGLPPTFRSDIIFQPLQAADMFSWLVRDCMTIQAVNMNEISRAALKYLEGREKIIRLHITKEMLLKLGAAFLVGKARLDGYL